MAHWIERAAGAEVRVWDPAIAGLPQGADFEGYDYIGFSPLAETLAEDLRAMREAGRANPAATLIAGGVEATLDYQTILEKTRVEWIVLGYGERALAEIVGGCESVAGTTRRRFGEPVTIADLREFYGSQDFSRMDYPAYWRQTERMYEAPDLDSIRTVRLVTSTHCNRGCAFCPVMEWQKQATGAVRPVAVLPTEDLIQLVSRVKSEVPEVRTIFFCEDDFCQSRSRVEGFCEWAKGSGLGYLVQTHLARLDQALIGTLASGGTRYLQLGIENASSRVLQSFGKPQDLTKVPQVIEWCAKAGVECCLLVILFAPSATMDDLRLNCAVLPRWMEMGASLGVEPYTYPYRGAGLWESAHDFEHEVLEIGQDAVLKRAVRIVPDDPAVRRVMRTFGDRWPSYLADRGPTHRFKRALGGLMVELLAEILEETGAEEHDGKPEPVYGGSG